MANSIKWRLVSLYVILVIIVMMVSGSLIVWLISNNEYSNIRKDLEKSADLITLKIDEETTPEQISEQLKSIIMSYGNLYSDKKVFLLDKKGEVIREQRTNESFYNPQVMGALYGNKPDELDTVRLEGYEEEFKGYAEPVYHNDQVEYVVYILASTLRTQETLQRTVGVIIMATVLAIFLAMVLGFFFSGFLTRPISMLSRKAKEMASGNLDNPIPSFSDDEIGQLTVNFNTMAASLKDTLDQISSEKNKLEIVFSHMTDGILVFNKEGDLTHYNPASISMIGIKGDETYTQIFGPYSELSFEDVFARVMENSIEHIVKIKERYYNLCLAKFLSQSEMQRGMICVIQDITEYKKLEEIQKEFVANVSHELRTPLTTIKSYTETLLDGALYETEIAEKFLGVINYEGDRMTVLVQDLLDLSRLDNKQTTFHMVELELGKFIEENLTKYLIHAEKKKQRLTFHTDQDAYTILGDTNRIEQVIKNVISNAVKYSDEGTDIDVSLYRKDNFIVVEVKDQGPGIPEQDLPRIFERFYRVDKARSREMGGTGLGLAIAKEIMEHHGGTIQVDSKANQGTTFHIAFPCSKEAGSVR